MQDFREIASALTLASGEQISIDFDRAIAKYPDLGCIMSSPLRKVIMPPACGRDLRAILAQVSDSRGSKGRHHSLSAMLTAVVCRGTSPSSSDCAICRLTSGLGWDVRGSRGQLSANSPMPYGPTSPILAARIPPLSKCSRITMIPTPQSVCDPSSLPGLRFKSRVATTPQIQAQ